MANFIFDDIKNSFRSNNHLTKIIIINVVIYILQNIIVAFSRDAGYSFILDWFGLPASVLGSLTHIWSFFTYMFFHSNEDIFHVIFNMLWLYWIGRIFVDFYQSKRFLSLYIIGGIFAGLFFVATSFILQLLGSSFIPYGVPLIGASGAVMAIIVGTAILVPNYELHLILLGRVKLKYIALASFIITSVLDINLNTGGKLAHLGGAIFGYLYGANLKAGRNITAPITNVFSKITGFFTGQKTMRVVYRSEQVKENQSNGTSPMSRHEIQRKTDEILDKINKSGYDSLTREEKDFLSKASKL